MRRGLDRYLSESPRFYANSRSCKTEITMQMDTLRELRFCEFRVAQLTLRKTRM